MSTNSSAGHKGSTGTSHYAVFLLLLLLVSSAAIHDARAGVRMSGELLHPEGIAGTVLHLFHDAAPSQTLSVQTGRSHSAAFFFRHKIRKPATERRGRLTEILECVFTPFYYCFSYPGMSLATFLGVALLFGLFQYLAARFLFRRVQGSKRSREFSVEV